jgi:hypothetical protein
VAAHVYWLFLGFWARGRGRRGRGRRAVRIADPERCTGIDLSRVARLSTFQLGIGGPRRRGAGAGDSKMAIVAAMARCAVLVLLQGQLTHAQAVPPLCPALDMTSRCGDNHAIHDLNPDGTRYVPVHSSWEACGQECNALEGCNSWVWIDPDGGNVRVAQGRGGQCFFKQAGFSSLQDSCISGDIGMIAGNRLCPAHDPLTLETEHGLTADDIANLASWGIFSSWAKCAHLCTLPAFLRAGR